jgi:GTP-binding protein HflX
MEDYMSTNKKSVSTAQRKEKAVLVLVSFENKQDTKMQIDELKSLAQATNLEVVGTVMQNKDKPDPAFLIGAGKLGEVKELVNDENADLVIFDNELTGSKIKNLEEQLNVRVIDRSMLILDIFARRAKTNEGKMQAELAQLKYALPRLSSLQGTQGRFGAGVGMRGPGETKLELRRRVIEKDIKDKEKQLEKLNKNRELARNKRNNSPKKQVAIVGYTNSGKSTLMNTITKADILAKNMLFATLDTTTRSVYLAPKKEILLVDTVGFVSKLPHEFIEAFSATLEEAVYADVILHVIDASNPLYKEQEQVAKNVLKDLGVKNKPIIKVYNKIDKVPNFDKTPAKNNVYVSALNNEGIDELKEKIIKVI